MAPRFRGLPFVLGGVVLPTATRCMDVRNFVPLGVAYA
jgi:hypothetical protein